MKVIHLSDTHVGRDVREGLVWLWRNPAVRTLALTILLFNVTWGAAWGVLVLYATDLLGGFTPTLAVTYTGKRAVGACHFGSFHEAMAAAQGVTVAWRPFLLGPIFAAQGWATSPFNIYAAKGRPSFNPLIAHVPDIAQALALGQFTERQRRFGGR